MNRVAIKPAFSIPSDRANVSPAKILLTSHLSFSDFQHSGENMFFLTKMIKLPPCVQPSDKSPKDTTENTTNSSLEVHVPIEYMF